MKSSVEYRIDTFSETLGERLANGTRPPPGSVRLYWLGQAGFVIESPARRWLIDPYLSDSLANKYRGARFDHVRMMPAPITPTELPPLDAVLCTHRHTDHMDPDTLQPLALAQPALRFVVPAASREEAARRCAVADERLIPAHVGRSIELGGSATVVPIASAHESFSVNAAGDHEWLGYVLTVEGIRIYHSGDCVPYDGLTGLLRERHIDVALLPVNGRDATRQAGNIPGNFTLDEAVELCRQAAIPHLVAHHYGLFAFNTIAAAEIDKRAADEAAVRVTRARPGEALAFFH
ncbi:MAG: MBL fold metallo-hydrolase [Propionivibrio sp.]